MHLPIEHCDFSYSYANVSQRVATTHYCEYPFTSTNLYNSQSLSYWWYTYLSEKYDFVNWDDDILNMWDNRKNVKQL